MARKVDITDKLTFEGNPCLIIKGEELEINADAPTMLKVMELMAEDPGPAEIMDAYDMIFREESKKQLEVLHLNFGDLIVVVQEAIGLIAGKGDTDQGEQ